MKTKSKIKVKKPEPKPVQFCRLEVIDGYQLLITKEDVEEDNPDAPYGLKVRTDVGLGCEMSLTMSFETEEKRDDGFSNVDPTNLFNSMKNQMVDMA